MANAKKLPSGNYRVRVYDKTLKKYKSFTAGTKHEAERMATEYLISHERSPKERFTVHESMLRYVATKKNILSPASIYRYEHIPAQFSDGFLKIRIDKLTQFDIDAEINRMCSRYSAKTVKNAHGFLSSVLKKYRPAFVLNTTLPKIQRKIKEYPKPEEIMKQFRGYEEMELVVLLALCFGLRKGEIRGLKKSDFKNGVMNVQRVIVKVGKQDIEKSDMKTASSKRRISVPSFIMDLVENVKGEYITNLPAGGIYKRFKTQMEKMGYPDITFHDLRHINASVMLALNVPDKYAMERGGWATDGVLKSVYQSTFSTERQKFDKVIDTYFSDRYDTKYDT